MNNTTDPKNYDEQPGNPAPRTDLLNTVKTLAKVKKQLLKGIKKNKKDKKDE